MSNDAGNIYKTHSSEGSFSLVDWIVMGEYI